jgi:Polysaccharide deacetylase
MKRFAFTLDLESDYAGLIDSHGILGDQAMISALLEVLRDHDIKLTVFVVGQVLEDYPDVIKLFQRYDCEFEVHSYSHNLLKPDSEDEIVKARNAYINYFGFPPMGYRAPQGRISLKGCYLLEKYGFVYDSSVFPSYYPNPFKYLLSQRGISYKKGTNIMEIPFSSITPLRITLSMSFIKLLGIKLFKQLFKLGSLPDIICFDSHLHDFIVNNASFDKLSKVWRLLLGRNRNKGIEYFEEFISIIKASNYKMSYMSEIYEIHKREELMSASLLS